MTRSTRTRLRRLAAALTALLATVSVGALAPSPANATTTTFANPAAIQGRIATGSGSNSTPIAVSATGTPTGSVYPSTINLAGVPGTITSLGLSLTFNHTAPDDLDILLVSPTGRTVVLMSDTGGFTDWDGALDLDFKTGSSTIPLPDSATFTNAWYDATNYVGNDAGGDVWPAPAPAVADPNASLNSLLGDSPDGSWKLFVHDDQDQDGGAISHWSLSVATDAVPTPAGTYPSSIPVSGLTGEVADVDLTIKGVTWRDLNGLDLMLVAPDGRKALVLSDVGGYNAVDDITLTLDDEAGSPLSALSEPSSGRYRPTNIGSGDTFPAPAPDASTAGPSLSVFDGAVPNGTWRLYAVQDEIDSVPGVISAGWSLAITTAPASPRVVGTTPASHASGVRRGADIRAVSSKHLRPGSVTGTTVYLTRVGSHKHLAATVRYFDDSRTIVLDPRHRLAAHTRYRVVVTTNVRDTAGHRLDQDPALVGDQKKTWRFRTK